MSLLLLVSVAACDREPGGQTVAVVNGQEVTAAELNGALNDAKLPEGMDEATARSRVLESMIDRRLLVQQAEKDGLDKTPEFLNRQRRLNEDILIGMLASRQLNTSDLPSPSEVSKFEASHPGMFARREIWDLQQLIYETPKDQAVIARIAATKTLDDLANVLTQAGIKFTRAKNRLDTAVIPPDMYAQVASISGGEPFLVPAGTKTVASSIVSREPAPLVGEQANPVAVAQIRRAEGAKFMENRLKSLRDSAKIDYKEGFAPPAASKSKKAGGS